MIEPSPTEARARFFEVDAHDDEKLLLQDVGKISQMVRVLECGDGVVDRARSDDDAEPVVETVDDPGDRLAPEDDDVFECVVEGELREDRLGRDERTDRRDAAVPQR